MRHPVNRCPLHSLALPRYLFRYADRLRTAKYGAIFWMAEKLNSEHGERVRGIWTKLGKMAFEISPPGGSNDKVQPQQDRM